MRGQLDSIIITHPQFTAEVLLQGAQLISFKPLNKAEWLWLSPLEQFKAHQSVRGGIPICLPWFGVNRHAKSADKHGFIRNNNCRLARILETESSVTLEFSYHYRPNSDASALFASEFIAKFSICLQAGDTHNINYDIELTHLSPSNQIYSYALHSYFNVDNIADVSVKGLEQHNYLDNTAALSKKQQQGSICFRQEVDRVYEATTQPQQLINPNQNLCITATAMPSCIVWNPHQSLASSISDIQQHYDNFICIERGCAFADEILLHPEQVHKSSMTISL